MDAEVIVMNGKIATMDPQQPWASAVAMARGRFLAVGRRDQVELHAGKDTVRIDVHGRTVIPGLNDSHTHLIRGGLSYNLELRWEGVSSLADALELLRQQVERTPAPQWVRVIGGWSEHQFRERRMPTLDELNRIAPDTPVLILHLYDRALLNRAALRALGYDTQPPAFDRGVIERDHAGRPTGMLLAQPSAQILYATIGRAPRLAQDDQRNATRQFLRELNRLGVTSVIDAGGGGQAYPDDYRIVQELAAADQLTVRIAYHLFAQTAGQEYDDYLRWVDMVRPGAGTDMLRVIGAGENLVWSAADFENFRQPRPELAADMEASLRKIVHLLAEHHWPFRIHATYDESITRFLDVLDAVDRDRPLGGLHWFIDHAETISEHNIERLRSLGGGIAIQHRMAFQGEYFVERYGREAARRSPPIRRMLAQGVPVGGGTDATRVASYNPWVCLYWLTTGRTLGGLPLYGDDNLLDRTEALALWTTGSAWFSAEQSRKGAIRAGELADLAVLSADYFSVPDEEIKNLQAVLTMVGGKVVHGTGEFAPMAPPAPPASPDWSPVQTFGGHQRFGAPLSAGPGCACWAF